MKSTEIEWPQVQEALQRLQAQGGAHCRVGDAVADRSNSGTDS